jgi:hypothetical protein
MELRELKGYVIKRWLECEWPLASDWEVTRDKEYINIAEKMVMVYGAWLDWA